MILYSAFDITATVQFQSSTYYLGFATGVIVPLLTNIQPIRKAMSFTLRDSLDLSRNAVDDLEVQMVKLENKGVNVSQIALSTGVMIISYLTLYVIPRAFADKMV